MKPTYLRRIQDLTVRSGAGAQEKHLNQLDENIWRTSGTCCVAGRATVLDPLYEYHDAQVAEHKGQEDHLRNELEEEAHAPPEVDVVEQGQAKTEEHLHDADDDRELHLH